MIYDISFKTLIAAKPLRISFDKTDGFIEIYDGTRYLVLLSPEKQKAICNRITNLISPKSNITYIFSIILRKSKLILMILCLWKNIIFSYEKILSFHNVIILIKSVLNKDQNHYYYKIFLEKGSYQLAKK